MALLKLLTPLAVIAVLAVGGRADDKPKTDKPKEEKKEDKKEEKKGGLGVKIAQSEGEKGFKLSEVNPGSPAEKAGLKADDVMLKIDGKEYEELRDFIAAIQAKKPGDKVTLTIKRGDKEMEIKVTLGDAPKPIDD